MPVVNRTSDLVVDLRVSKAVPDPSRARGRIIVACGTVTHAVDDNTNSTYLLAEIPADCILDKSTAFKLDTWNMGANVSVGVPGAAGALINNAAKGANMQPIVFGDARHGLPAWQALGLAAAPADNTLSIILTAVGNATLVGSGRFEIAYRMP